MIPLGYKTPSSIFIKKKICICLKMTGSTLNKIFTVGLRVIFLCHAHLCFLQYIPISFVTWKRVIKNHPQNDLVPFGYGIPNSLEQTLLVPEFHPHSVYHQGHPLVPVLPVRAGSPDLPNFENDSG